MLVRIDESGDSSATDSSRWRFAASAKPFAWHRPTTILNLEKIRRAQEIEVIQDVTTWQGNVIASVNSDAVHLDMTIPGWGAHVVEIQYEPGNYTFENVSIEEDRDGATVRWRDVDVLSSAVDYREEGKGEWLRKDGTRRNWVYSAMIETVDIDSAQEVQYRLIDIESDGAERCSEVWSLVVVETDSIMDE